MKNFRILFFFLFISVVSHGQTDSTCTLRISLLTCTAGEELYLTWGHSAIRVSNSANGTDIIYNYGTFDFYDPSFYSKFVKGSLLYFVSVDEFGKFLEEYKYEGRGITEQVLNLSCAAKEKLMLALKENAKEENKYYKYDFVTDNCTTRLRDMVFKNADSLPVINDIRPSHEATARTLIHENLDKSNQLWSRLGIDILLGTAVDKKLSIEQAMFLPEYLLKGFDSTRLSGKELVASKSEILQPTLKENEKPLLSPLLVFTILFFVFAFLGIIRKANGLMAVFDFILFFISGALGILMLFMWFGTDHPECKNNFNLIWAFPPHLIMIFFLFKRWKWMRFYFLFNSILLLILLIAWRWLPQEMNNSVIPFVCLLLLRNFLRFKKLSDGDR